MDIKKGPLEEPAREWFVNRRAELDLFWKWATGIPHPGSKSFALVGLRRTGKTAIIHKTFNRLFNEQDRVMPVYISFVQYLKKPEPITAFQFAEEYFAGYMRSYLAFRYRQPLFHSEKENLDNLRDYANEVEDEFALKLFHTYDREPVNKRTAAHSIMQWVINLPKGYAWTREMPTAMFVDEFQVLTRVLDPDDGRIRNLTDSFQHAAETRYAPLLVSGSSVSMMMGEALSGLVSGRFQHWYVQPLSREFAIDLALRLGKAMELPVTEELALAIYEITKGYPYSIERILQSLSPDIARLPDKDALDQVVFFELTHNLGALRVHYTDEYGKYIGELNGDNVTRKILYWITNYPGEHLRPRRIAKQLDMDFLSVRDSLEKLYWLDIVDRVTSETYRGPIDPLLLRYLRYQHHVTLADLSTQDAAAELRKEINTIRGEMNYRAGHFTEIIVSGVMNNYDDREVEGEAYFHVPDLVTLPRMEKIYQREGVVKRGAIHEVDVIGEYKLYNKQEGNAGLGAWLVSVRYRAKKMGVSDVDEFLASTDAVQSEKRYGEIVRWHFSKAGFTKTAREKLRAEGIYASDLNQFNALADLFGLLPLSM